MVEVTIRNLIQSKAGELSKKIPPFDPHKHGSVIDYLDMIVEEAKIAPFRQELNDLYEGFKNDGKSFYLSFSVVLSMYLSR